MIVQPGVVYGPGDHAIIGQFIDQASKGKMPAKAFPDMGITAVFVDDVADGIMLAHDKGKPGESYVLGGELTTQGELIDKAAAIGGKKPPRMTVPPLLLKAMIPVGRFIGPPMGLPPNFREMISAAHNVTYLARDDKARRELGYQPRDLDTGLRETIGAVGARTTALKGARRGILRLSCLKHPYGALVRTVGAGRRGQASQCCRSSGSCRRSTGGTTPWRADPCGRPVPGSTSAPSSESASHDACPTA